MTGDRKAHLRQGFGAFHMNRGKGGMKSEERKKEAATGFEPMNSDFADRCLTTWLRRQENGAGNGIRTRDFDLGKVALYH